jgi:TolB-like protein
VNLLLACGLSVAVLTQSSATPQLSIVHADNSPVRIESAQIEAGSATGLRVRYLVSNLRQQQIDRLIVTAAIVNAAQEVTSTRLQAIEDRIDGRGQKEQFVVFPRLVPASGERVVFGVQAVGWSGGREWRGVLRLVSKTTASD